ncbi:MAG: hypothetical protein AB7S38_05260 [Vulcanimicrobiota bacterium]
MHYLNHPRQADGPSDHWELQRGYRLRVVGSDSLVLYLGPATGQELQGELMGVAPLSGEEALLLVLASQTASAGKLEAALQVCDREGWNPRAVLVLWDSHQATTTDRPGLKKAARGDRLVVLVDQEMPPESFFNPEQVLHQLGRISRRIQRRVAWRRHLPF